MVVGEGFIPSVLVSREVVPVPGSNRVAPDGRDGVLRPVSVGGVASGPGTRVQAVVPSPKTAEGHVLRSPLEETWYEIVHVFPRSLSLGNILSEVVDSIVIFNAFRTESVTWSAVSNDAGSGVAISGTTPPPDVVIEAKDAVSLSLTISPVGAPVIDGSITFTFTSLYAVPITISGSRLVVFAFVPERPITERLEWATDVLEAIDGSEQRIALRDFPRQVFSLDYVLDEGADLTRFDNTMFDWHARVFGVPVWHEPTTVTLAVTSGDLTVSVASTANADYRVGGLAVVLADDQNFDALEISSLTATSITFKSPAGADYPAGTEVYPMRTARAGPQVSGSRAARGRATRRVDFRVTENDVGDALADASAFSTHDGLVLLDDPNAISGSLRESLSRRLIEFDNDVGVFSAETPWSQDKRASAKGLRPRSRAALWNIRRLLHELRGRQQSFWLPTFYKDLVVADTVQGGTATLVIESSGFAQFLPTARPNKKVIRLETNSGGSQVREIVSAGTLSATQESITVSPAWDAGDITVADVRRVMFFERVRLAADAVEIRHLNNFGHADLDLGVISVFDA